MIDSCEKPAKIFLKLKKMFRNECASQAHVFEWARRFKEGRRSVYDDERPNVTARMQHSQMKAMLVCFFDVHGIVHHEFVPPHQAVMAKFYIEVLGCLRAQIMWVRIITMHCPIYLAQYTNIWRKKIFPHCHTHPTARPRSLWLFSVHEKLKSVLKGARFDDLEEIKANMSRVLKALTSSDFKLCLKLWERRWNKCVILVGGLLWGYWGLVCVKLLNLIF